MYWDLPTDGIENKSEFWQWKLQNGMHSNNNSHVESKVSDMLAHGEDMKLTKFKPEEFIDGNHTMKKEKKA